MFDKIKQAPAAVKNFVAEHKTTVAVAVTAGICMAVNRAALNQHNEFLKEHDLYESYYNPEDSY